MHDQSSGGLLDRLQDGFAVDRQQGAQVDHFGFDSLGLQPFGLL
jgi:hypothetical protein